MPASSDDSLTDALVEARAELTAIRVAVAKVSLYQDLLGPSPLALMVDELVRDHSELEARIDAAMFYLQHALRTDASLRTQTVSREVARLLTGGKRLPDDASELT